MRFRDGTLRRRFQNGRIPEPDRSGVAGEGILDVHVFEFAALEDFATLDALDEFRIGMAGNDLHPRVAAWLVDGTADGRLVALRLQ